MRQGQIMLRLLPQSGQSVAASGVAKFLLDGNITLKTREGKPNKPEGDNNHDNKNHRNHPFTRQHNPVNRTTSQSQGIDSQLLVFTRQGNWFHRSETHEGKTGFPRDELRQ